MHNAYISIPQLHNNGFSKITYINTRGNRLLNIDVYNPTYAGLFADPAPHVGSVVIIGSFELFR
jgi:hypothetical protein